MLNTQVGVDLILPMLFVCDDHGGAHRHCFLAPTLPRSGFSFFKLPKVLISKDINPGNKQIYRFKCLFSL
ncbi:hypothetical protein RHGRI_013993 [Rhododendron griersonianum]|uniref:Uncharacterized protein n=1 Tax=Rhododendron griersonianum TaxID=479676 RepID=A0AAV6K7N4_9ERIC|nr:hypothetical protein RHGRI_013993 [Rhododendron griersonianum]